MDTIQIRTIINRIDMQPGSVHAAGLSLLDSLPFDKAIQFVQERTYAKGRWTVDKASKAQAYLNELLQFKQMPIEQAVTMPETVANPIDETAMDAPATPVKIDLTAWQTRGLLALVIAPTAASVHNMHTISHIITGSWIDGILLTIVLSCTGLGFVLCGVRGKLSGFVTLLLIAYECFCNLVRIYGGLYTETGNPGKFLNMVTEIFGSGTNQTAILLGGIVAVFIAAVQYVGIFELKNRM